jgi:hypothetical protein
MTGKAARKGGASKSGGGARGSSGSTGRKKRRRRPRPGARRRQALLAGCASTVVFSLILSVDRTGEGRKLAESITELRREEEVLRIRQSEEFVRVDSLSSRERILVAAARFGLRPARDDEVVHLPDVGP